MRNMPIVIALLAMGLCGISQSPYAGEQSKPIQLSKDRPELYVIHDGKSVKVERSQDPGFTLKGYFAKTGRPCPPACLKPMSPAEGVEPIGEAELFDFMENDLRDGTGLLIDARTDVWWKKGTIPGASHYPYTLMTQKPDSEGMKALLEAFGAKPRGKVTWVDSQLEKWGLAEHRYKTDKWDFSNAKTLVIFCNGPSCGQSPRAIRGLVAAGYPADKIKYYRGGMRMWQFWGLNTIRPADKPAGDE